MSLIALIPSTGSLQLLAGAILGLFALNSVLKYIEVLRSIGYHPGPRYPVSAARLLSLFLPYIPGISPGPNWAMDVKHEVYAQHGWDIITLVGALPSISVDYFVVDPLAVREITSNRARFPKPVEDYKILSPFGPNILVTEGDEWKKQRKLAAPTFSEKNNVLVWNETVRIIEEMLARWGPDSSKVVLDHCLDMTFSITLFVMISAGFGRRISWTDDTVAPPGHKLTFKDAVYTTSKYMRLPLVFPRWTFRFSTFLQSVGLAFEEFDVYMREMVEERRAYQTKEVGKRYDLLTALLKGSVSSNDNAQLTESEIIGNIFIFLIAGHETTAHTLCFLFGLLALDQEEQEKLYQRIFAVLPNGEIPTYEQYGELSYVLAVIHETLRLFPPVIGVPKFSVEATTIPTARPDGSIVDVPIPKGARLVVHTTGLHYNPRYWEDPHAFNPLRFLGDWNREAFLPFSGGPRACIGRGFAETETVAAVTMIIQKYRIELKNPELYEGLMPLEKRAKLLAYRQGLTITPINVPLAFVKRS